ncbi:MAG: helix-turn-helix domain-containing protein [Fusobacterium gastrosuis]|uniref:helix-turn-helix domain-containing protein n=1 Tax=Fusobacterium gastrosuis TaxID=1755100 RepID=UPI002A850AA1|nr:helix-turn-helix domain-containing protein [Fusobacterium gastrosuis]
MEKPNYYGILPANVRYDKNLKPMAKILYTEITALSNKNGYCNATNSYFANLYEVSKNTVSLWISDLEKAGYIKTDLIYENGTKNIKERRIYINNTPITKNDDTYHKKEEEGITKNNDTPITKNDEDNNTSNNNTSLILKEKINKKEKTLYIAFDENERIKKENEAKELIKNSNFSEEAKEKIIYWWFFVKPKAIKKKLAGNISLIRLLERDYIFNSPHLSEFMQLAEERLWQDLLPTCWDNFIKNKQINEKLKSKSEEKRINHQTTGAVKTKPDSWWENL